MKVALANSLSVAKSYRTSSATSQSAQPAAGAMCLNAAVGFSPLDAAAAIKRNRIAMIVARTPSATDSGMLRLCRVRASVTAWKR